MKQLDTGNGKTGIRTNGSRLISGLGCPSRVGHSDDGDVAAPSPIANTKSAMPKMLHPTASHRERSVPSATRAAANRAARPTAMSHVASSPALAIYGSKDELTRFLATFSYAANTTA